jgi:ribokinase
MSNPAANGRVVVAGAINTDLVGHMKRAPRAGETITGSGFAVFGGGKGANQAVAAARSGSVVGLVGAVGNDQFGTDRLRDLQRDGIDVTDVKHFPDVASGAALIFVEATGENRIAYIPGATSLIDPGTAIEAYARFQPDVVLVPNELPTDALLALLKAAHQDGITTVLNATPEPGSVRDALQFTSILVVNEHEAVELLGEASSGHAATARRLGEHFDLQVIITAGADGVYLWDGTHGYHVRGPQREAVDTTGAGDTFAGAFASELSRGVELTAAVRFGVHAAGLSVTRHGAQASIPARSDVIASMAEDSQD